MTGTAVYKILRRDELVDLIRATRFEGSADDVADGFIHLSTAAQLPGTLEKHFATDGSLYLVALAAGLDPALQWEVSRGGQAFPHLYRALEIADILAIRPIPDVGRAAWCGILPQT